MTPRHFKRKHRSAVWLAATFALVGISAFIASGVRVVSLIRDVEREMNLGVRDLTAGAEVVKSAGPNLTAKQANRVAQEFHFADDHFSRAEARLGHSRLLALLGIVPAAHTQLQATWYLADIGRHLSHAGWSLGQSLVPLLIDNPSASSEPSQRILQALDAIDVVLDPVSSDISSAANDRRKLPAEHLIPQLSAAVHQLDAKLNLEQIQLGLRILRADEPTIREILGCLLYTSPSPRD